MEKLINPGNKIIRFPQHLYAIQKELGVYPLHVEMDLSNLCNLECPWCLYSYTHDETLMDRCLGLKILDQLCDVGLQAVTFSGGGEPTTSPDFNHLVEYAKNECGLAVGVYTNGIKYPKITWALIQNVITWLQIGLDAHDKESYKKIKGANWFDDIYEYIAKYVKLAKDTTIGLGFSLNEHNWMYARRMLFIGEELGVDYIQFRPILGLEDYHWVDGATGLLDELTNHGVFYYPRQRFMDLLDHQHGLFNKGYTVCRGSELVPCIGADGALWVCTNTRGARKLGDLKTEKFVDIWDRRKEQLVGADCHPTCRNHELNKTLEYVCSDSRHKGFV